MKSIKVINQLPLPMKKTVFSILLVLVINLGFCQSDSDVMIDLGKSYRNFMFSNEATKNDLKALYDIKNENLKSTVAFIAENLKTKNSLLDERFLKLPEDKSLKQIYIVRAINHNIRKEDQVDNLKLVDSLIKKEIPRNELVDCYYDILFNGVGNKNKPFNLSKFDLKLNNYNLKNDTEKGILFLKCMDLCGTSIWGYINIPKPPNYKLAMEFISKFPTINGRPYYQNQDLYFPDFEMIIDSEKGVESYKGYYLNKYFETLIYNLVCLKKLDAKEEDTNKLLLGSILKDSKLYKYTKYKDLLEDIFTKVKKE